MSGLPTTAQVLAEIKTAGVIVGSWPRLGDEAKDIDVVIRSVTEGRNPIFRRLKERFGEAFQSSAPGHGFVQATPINVEVFEDRGWPVDDESKRGGMLTYNQARRRSKWVDCYGVPMRAVSVSHTSPKIP